jgi:hypothetical protein
MKEWLKKFFKGTYVACCMIIAVGVAFIVLWVIVMGAMVGSAWLNAMAPPTTNNIIIMLCIFFVVVFGLIWSTWS